MQKTAKYLKWRDKAQSDKIGQELVRKHEKKQAKSTKIDVILNM
jgi:hypothetical protein